VKYFAQANNHAVSIPLQHLWPKPRESRLYRVNPPIMVNIALKTGDIPQPLPYRFARVITMDVVEKDVPRFYFFRTVDQAKGFVPVAGFLTAAECTMEGQRTFTVSYEDGKSTVPVRGGIAEHLNKDPALKITSDREKLTSFRTGAVCSFGTEDDPERRTMCADTPTSIMKNVIHWASQKQ
jgi:hypothetical protein